MVPGSTSGARVEPAGGAPLIVLDSDRAEEQVDPADIGLRETVHRTAALDEALRACATDSVRVLITDADAWWPRAIRCLAAGYRATGRTIATVWRTDLSPRCLAELLLLVGLEPGLVGDVHVSLRSYEPDLSVILGDGEFERSRNATALILAETLHLVPEECARSFVATIAACERRVSTGQVGAIAGDSGGAVFEGGGRTGPASASGTQRHRAPCARGPAVPQRHANGRMCTPRLPRRA